MSHNDYFLKYKDKLLFEDRNSINECFNYFDKDSDGNLNEQEFEALLKSLYSFNGNSYYISQYNIRKLFNYYDKDKKNRIDINDFVRFWNTAVKSTLFARNALVVVDVQKDFINGTLSLKRCPAKEDGNEVVPIINDLISQVPFDLIVYTQDWHPADHISFYENISLRKLSDKSKSRNNIKVYETVEFEKNSEDLIEQKLWPTHCVQNTDGADFDSNLIMVNDPDRSFIVRKGTHSEVDSYSAFFDNSRLSKTELDDELRKRNITDLYVCGVATDVCVAATASDGYDLSYRVVLIENACRGVDTDQIASTKKRLINKGALVVNSKQVYKMITCEDRRPELLYPLVKEQ